MNINWNLYKIFYYVAKCGTTSAAANELRIAQPAVSHGVKQLEDTLGCKLFDRSSHGMTPNSMGKMLYEHISDAVSSIEIAERLLETEIKASHKIINIGVSDITLQFFLIPFLETYQAENPDVEINTLLCKNVDELMQLFKEKKIDFAVLHDAPDDEENYKSVPVLKVRDVVFCSTKFKDRVKEKVLTPADFRKYPFVIHEKGCVVRKNVDEYMAENGASIKPEYEYALNSSIIRQAKRKFALGIMHDLIIYDELEEGSLVEIPVSPPFPERYFYFISPRRIYWREARKLADYILKSLPKE